MNKALEILKDSINNIDYLIKSNKLDKHETTKYKDRLKYLNEAIAELKALQNRSCDNCSNFKKDGAYYGICNKDINTTKNQDKFLSNIDFCCNKWESKD